MNSISIKSIWQFKHFVASLALLLTVFSLATHLSAQDIPPALNFTMKSIEGEDVALNKYAGKVIVFVNTASECGYTKQYKQLQALHAEHGEKGVAVIGIPCNQFGGQEPGTEKEIAAFCEKNYGVEFDMMSKVDVNGDDQCGLYKHLTRMDLAPAGTGKIKWNFEKIVLDRTGTPIARFGSKVSPDSDAFMDVIKKAIGGGHYSHTSKKSGRTYYLFSKEVPLKNSDKTSTIYFFAKDPNNAKGKPLAEVPADRIVSETKSGMLVLKKKK
ncbi:MAG: glutathione peroxidase [Mariniblastus sp.]